MEGRKEGRKAVEMEGLWTEAESMDSTHLRIAIRQTRIDTGFRRAHVGLWSVRIFLCTLAAS
jgi:hypothetical protein